MKYFKSLNEEIRNVPAMFAEKTAKNRVCVLKFVAK